MDVKNRQKSFPFDKCVCSLGIESLTSHVKSIQLTFVFFSTTLFSLLLVHFYRFLFLFSLHLHFHELFDEAISNIFLALFFFPKRVYSKLNWFQYLWVYLKWLATFFFSRCIWSRGNQQSITECTKHDIHHFVSTVQLIIIWKLNANNINWQIALFFLC